MTLQRRVLVYLALAAVASCALTVVVAAVLVRNRVAAQRVSALIGEADLLSAGGGTPTALGPGQHVYRLNRSRPVLVGPFAAGRVLAAIPPGNDVGTVTLGARQLLFVARVTPRGRIVLVRNAALAFADWRPFLTSLVLAGLGGALLALVLSYALARRLTRPIGELSAATRRLAAGDPLLTVPVRGHDELAQLASSFNAMAAELAAAREAQRGFLESVSHELKTPLTAIRGYGEALADDAVAPVDAGEVIVAESERLRRLVDDLLELARFGRADFAVERTPVDLEAVAQQVVQRHAPRAAELGVALRADVTPGASAVGDAQRLLQAVSNLVENALRLTPAGGEVLVSVSSGRIEVRDTGPGLAAEDLPRAFERFYLHDRYRSERADGSGLGLAIVRGLVEAMGGSVHAGRAAGSGALFTLELPLAATPGPLERPGAGRPSA
jgi:signal transduction histidine kinase